MKYVFVSLLLSISICIHTMERSKKEPIEIPSDDGDTEAQKTEAPVPTPDIEDFDEEQKNADQFFFSVLRSQIIDIFKVNRTKQIPLCLHDVDRGRKLFVFKDSNHQIYLFNECYKETPPGVTFPETTDSFPRVSISLLSRQKHFYRIEDQGGTFIFGSLLYGTSPQKSKLMYQAQLKKLATARK